MNTANTNARGINVCRVLTAILPFAWLTSVLVAEANPAQHIQWSDIAAWLSGTPLWVVSLFVLATMPLGPLLAFVCGSSAAILAPFIMANGNVPSPYSLLMTAHVAVVMAVLLGTRTPAAVQRFEKQREKLTHPIAA